MKFFVIFFIVLLFNGIAIAQLPVCSGPGSGLIYYVDNGQIYNLDPTQPLSATNPSANTLPVMPSFAAALAVCNNINGGATSPTFYTTDGTFYYYYNGTSWVNTGHSPGNSGAVNIGGGTHYIYSLVGFTGQIYRYDGTSNAILLTTVSTFNGGGPYDIVVDCNDNFYLLNTTLQTMEEYNSNGILIKTFTTNSPLSSAGGGFAIIGNTVYYNNTSGYVSGPIIGNTINFSIINASGLSPSPSDFASCIFGSGSNSSSNDTLYACANGASVALTAPDNPPYVWSIKSGSGNIIGSGKNINVTVSSNLLVVLTDSTICGLGTDSFHIIVPNANINFESSSSVVCHTKTTALSANISNNPNNTNFTWQWTPTNAIVSGGNTLAPIVNLDSSLTYYLTLTSSPNQGNCVFTKRFDFNILNCDTLNIKLPSAFSPDHNGINDIYRLLGNTKNVNYLDFRIYNRWGQEVFATSDPFKGWDGNFLASPSPAGVYVYSVVYKINGNNDYSSFSGNVTLIR